MDAQHQKTNKSTQFACYLGEHTSSSSITSYIYLFALLFPPSIHLFLLYSAFKQDYQASKQATKRGRKFLGTTFFFLSFFWETETKGYDNKNYLALPDLTSHQPATANRRTVNCDLETKPLCVITQKWSMHAIICDIQFAHGVNLPIFLVTLFFIFPFIFPFFSSFSIFSAFCTYISMSTARLTLSICVFLGVKYQETHKVPTYLALTFLFSLSFAILLGIIAGYLAACYVVSK